MLRGGMIARHAGRTQQGAVAGAVREQPSTSGKPGVPHAGHSDDSSVRGDVRRQPIFPSLVGVRTGIVPGGLGGAVHRARF